MLVYTGEAIYAFVTLTEGATMTPEITKGLKTVCVCVCVYEYTHMCIIRHE